MQLSKLGLIPWLLLCATPVVAQINAAALPPTPSPPFKLTKVAQFDLPWRIAFLPDGRMLVTTKEGAMHVISQENGEASPPIEGVRLLASLPEAIGELKTWQAAHA